MLKPKELTLKKEDEIVALWNNHNKVLVSIVCVVYNHDQFLEETISSFLMQNTNFAFEIIIHDDASTDRTTQIVRDFARKYPNIIKPIYQEENRYQKGNFKPGPYAAGFAIGDYIALCEGDDYWVDIFKLQKQVDSLKDSGCSLCFTKSVALNSKNVKSYKSDLGSINKIVSASEVIRGGGGYMVTASLLIHRDIFKNLPHWFDKAPVGDYYLQMLGSIKSGALYLPSVTSVYRVNSVGSFTRARIGIQESKLLNEQERHQNCLVSMLKEYPEHETDIIYALARLKAIFSIELIVNGYYKSGVNLIIQSWSLTPNIGIMQKIIYRTRYTPIITRIFLRCYKWFKE